ncbi:hypothetical protein I4U23_009126 [Adineta vaga]|nr:hypothetical protein I4U23_009126 [Adineta vaga]
MLSYLFSLVKQILYRNKFSWITFSTSIIFFITTIQRYHRLRNEYEHYDRRYQMLHSITIQKQDELENLINYINQLLILVEDRRNISIRKNDSTNCVYDHGDHSTMSPLISIERYSTNRNEESDDDDDDDDPLLQRLKLTKPSRLKSSSSYLINNHT